MRKVIRGYAKDKNLNLILGLDQRLRTTAHSAHTIAA